MTRLPVSLISICLFCAFATAQAAPHYRVDPFWPKELPNNWILGQIRGVTIDSHNHVWVLNEGVPSDDSRGECCTAAPAVVEFGVDGNTIEAWGDLSMYLLGRWRPTAFLWTNRETYGLAAWEAPGTRTRGQSGQRTSNHGIVKF